MNTILNPPKKDWKTILQRPTKTVDDIENTVNAYCDVISDDMTISVLQFHKDEEKYYTPKVRNLKCMFSTMHT